MADNMTPDVRSHVMSRIRARNTRPELYVRKAVWSRGFRYRLHVRRLPGVPDLVFAKYRISLFVHGCFWHQHGCKKSRRPSSNRDYWEKKLDGNINRDMQNQARLRQLGWNVITIWECRLKQDTEKFVSLLEELRGDQCRESVARIGMSPCHSPDRAYTAYTQSGCI